MQKFIIKGRLSGLNEYIKANRTNVYMANNLKKQNEDIVHFGAIESNLEKMNNYPLKLKITWYEPNNRRDIDNIVFATKFIQDSLVKYGYLVNDNQKCINELEHRVLVDKEFPRIEVEIGENKK